jgi:hypothetical protein
MEMDSRYASFTAYESTLIETRSWLRYYVMSRFAGYKVCQTTRRPRRSWLGGIAYRSTWWLRKAAT